MHKKLIVMVLLCTACIPNPKLPGSQTSSDTVVKPTTPTLPASSGDSVSKGQDTTSGTEGTPAGDKVDPLTPGSESEVKFVNTFTPCALPFVYKNDLKETDADAKTFEEKLGGASAVERAVERMPKFACSLLYATPEDAAKVGRAKARIIVNISPTPWKQVVPQFVHTDGKQYYDYTAGDMRHVLLDDKKEPVKNTLGIIQHEVGHIAVPLGKGPKWIGETMGDYIRLKAGFVDDSRRKDEQAKHFCYGYNTGAYFFEWIESKHPGFIKKFNAFLAKNSNSEWPGGYPKSDANSSEAFVASTGVALSALWADYRKSLGGIDPPMDCEDACWTHY